MMTNLTKQERKVFGVLLDHRTVSKSTLLHEAWGVHPEVADKIATRTVAMTISRLRKKLPKVMQIICRPEVGYVLLVG